MKKYVVSMGYGENFTAVPEYQTIGVIEAETAQDAALEVFNGLEKQDEENAIFQVKEEDSQYKYFTF